MIQDDIKKTTRKAEFFNPKFHNTAAVLDVQPPTNAELGPSL